MRKLTRFLSLMMAILLSSSMAFADFVEVGGGTTTTTYAPVNGLWDYGWNQVVYLQTEIGGAQTFDKLAYQLGDDISAYEMTDQKIWMKHTTDAAFSSTDYPDPQNNGFTLVYDGSVTFDGNDETWLEIVLDNTFDYNGSDNLIVLWENHDGSYVTGYPKFYYSSITNRCVRKTQDGSFPAVSGLLAAYVPNIRFFYTPPAPVDAWISGVVENVASGDPVNGALVTATDGTGTYSSYTDDNGAFIVQTGESTYDLTITKIGYGSANVNGIVTTIPDTTVLPAAVELALEPYEPMFVEATVNATDDACLVEWGLPSGDYEIVYDDGVAENMIAWYTEGNMNAVKFTPAGYPAIVKGGKIYVGDGSYPAGGAFLNVDFGVAVYAADGVNGMPGTLLDSIVVTPTEYGWVNFMGLNAEVLSGDFYIAMVQGGDYPACAPIGIDETAPQKFRSYSRNLSNGGAWGVSAYQDFMIRAIVEGSNSGSGDYARAATIWPAKIEGQTSQNQTNTTFGKEGSPEYNIISGAATRGVDHYIVYRVSNFDPEDPMDPGTETLLNNNVSGLSYNDNGFGAQPSGYYRYNVYAAYESGEVSDAAVSNVVGHALSADVTFEVSTTDGESPAGAIVNMTGLAYPYFTATETVPASGTLVVEDVDFGDYDITVQLSGYDLYELSSYTVDGEETIVVILSESKYAPSNLFVEPTTLFATWNEPSNAIASEGFEGGAIPAGWSTQQVSGTANWTVTTGGHSGNPGAAHTGTYNALLYSSSASAWLISPEYDLTVCTNEATLTFWHTQPVWAGDQDNLEVYYRTGGGAWQLLEDYTSSITSWTEESITLTGDQLAEDFQIGFLGNAAYGYGIGIDDVAILGDFEVAPASYMVYLDGAQVGTADVTEYQYTNLNFGQTYVAGVAAVYSSGVSDIITYEFTAAFLPPPRDLEGEVVDHDAILSWTAPGSGSGEEYEIVYTDDTPENATAWNVVGSENALKMTPEGYPCQILSISLNIYDGTWPAGNILTPMEVLVYDDNGAGGLPGDLLGSKVVTPANYNWVEVDMSDLNININDGDFYAAMKQIGTYPDCPPIAIDEDAGVNRSYSRAAGDPWGVANYQDFMFKARVYGETSGDKMLGANTIEIPAVANVNALTAQAPVQNAGTVQEGPAKYVHNTRAPLDGVLDNLIAYNVYRDGGFIAQTDANTRTYTDVYAPAGTHEYSVTAVYQAPTAGESLEEGPIELYIYGEGTISGNVSVMGTPLVPLEGATVTAYREVGDELIYEAEATTDNNGAYSMTVLEASYTVVCEAADYESQEVVGQSVANGGNTIVDFIMLESPAPALGVYAERNYEHTQVDVSWYEPSNYYQIIYDNDDATNVTAWDVAGNMHAVKFTPAGYPTDVLGGYVNIYDGSWPSGNSLQPFTMFAALADGENGMPGTMLDSITVSPAAHGWVEFNFAGGNFVEEGDFFIIMRQDTDYPNCAPIAVDATAGANRSYSRYITGGKDWELSAYQDYMIRAKVYGDNSGRAATEFNAELNLAQATTANTLSKYSVAAAQVNTQKLGQFVSLSTESVRGLESYTIFRLNNGQQNSPDTWTLLDEGVTATEWTDMEWPSLENGFYVYAVVSVYSYNQSPAAFSNVVPKGQDSEVTVNVSTNTGDSPEGALVSFVPQGNGTIVEQEAPADGVTFFHELTNGWYNLTVSKPGYESYILEGLYVNQDMEIDAVLNEACLPPQMFHVTMDGIATWLPPVLDYEEVFFEGFEGGMIPSGWTQITDPNMNPDQWVVQTGGAGGHPAGAFEGEYNALFNGSSSITKLVTPAIDLGGAIAPELSFWFAQPASSGQDKLAVFYKNTASGSWQALMSEAGDVPYWTKKNIELPNPTATYFIAFEGTAPETGGYGVSLDNVRVVKGVEPGDDRALEGYNVYLNGVFQNFTTDLTYTYTGLTVAQAYIGGVSAKYTNCESPIVLYPFTYYTCDFFAPIRNLEASLINCDVQLTWEPPGDIEPQEYDIIYTDDTPENATAWNVVNSENALRMTPAGYPMDVLTVSVNIYDGTWPAGNILNPMEVLVYAGDGTGGLPGTMLGSKVITPANYNWVEIDMSDLGITITDGDFYVSHKQIGTYPDCPPTAIDEGAGVNRSYSKVDGESWTVASYQDFMFKAHVYGMYFGDRVIDGGSVNVPATANAAALTANEPVVNTGMQEVQNGKFVYADGREMRALRGYNVYRDGDKINDVLLNAGSTVYTDTPPYGGVYVYGVTAEYDEGHACAVEVEVDVCGHLPAPTDLTGEDVDYTAHLWWNAPSTSLSTWMHYDDGEYTGSVGAGEAQFDVAIRFPVDVLAPYEGLSMTTLRIYMSTSGVNSLYTGKVWTKTGANDPELVAEIEIDEASIVWDAWNDFELETPLVIDATKELWFGYYIDEPDGDFAAAGSSVAQDGLGNMIYYGGAWATLLELAPTLDYNWMIRGYVTDDAGDRMEMSAIANTSTYNTFGELANTNVEPQKTVLPTGSRAVLLGYNVYRDGGDEPVNMDVIPDTTYDDVDLLPGYYDYVVTAVYDEGESYPEGPITVKIGEDLPVPPAPNADVQCNDVVLSWGSASAKLWDDFEMYADFTLDLSPWILNDVDGSTTYGFTGIAFPNSGAAMAFIAFNSLATDPPMDENLAYSGDKFAACFAATTPPNNDWMITPKLMIDEGDVFNFMAKSYTDEYGLERFKVAVSTTGTNPEDFTVISEGEYVEAPADAYGMFEYDLAAYAGQEIHIAINCVSNDAFIFMVDDVYVGPAGKARIAGNDVSNGTVARTEVAWNGEVYAPASNVRIERDLLGYNVFMDNVQVNTELVTENTYTVEDLEAGTYGFQINAVYDEGTSARTDVVEATIEEYVAVSDLAGEINMDGYPELTWSAPAGRALESYKVYRDGEMIAEGITETTYVDEEAPLALLCYTVVAVYTDCESVPSNEVCVTVGINDINGNELSVYPNPATDVVNVRHSGQIEQITVVNAVGQVVAEIMTSETNVAINVSNYESGVYMLRMRAADGTLTTKRVTIAE